MLQKKYIVVWIMLTIGMTSLMSKNKTEMLPVLDVMYYVCSAGMWGRYAAHRSFSCISTQQKTQKNL